MKKFPLNLVALKYFIDAVRQESISASAKLNFVSQSAISQAISKLEDELGCTLICHTPNQFKLTDDGKKLYDHSQKIFKTIKEAEHAFLHDETVTLNIACTHSFALSYFSSYINQIHESLPHLKINLRLAHGFTIMDWVKKGIVDMGILLNNIDLSYFHQEVIFEGMYRLYTTPSVNAQKSPFFLMDNEERVETNILKNAYKKKYKDDIPVLMEVSSWEVVASLVEEGLGVGFFPDYIALKKHQKLVPFRDSIALVPYKLNAIFHRNAPISETIKNLLHILST